MGQKLSPALSESEVHWYFYVPKRERERERGGGEREKETARERNRKRERTNVWAIIFLNRPGQNKKSVNYICKSSIHTVVCS
jgi:hypothetical protein